MAVRDAIWTVFFFTFGWNEISSSLDPPSSHFPFLPLDPPPPPLCANNNWPGTHPNEVLPLLDFLPSAEGTTQLSGRKADRQPPRLASPLVRSTVPNADRHKTGLSPSLQSKRTLYTMPTAAATVEVEERGGRGWRMGGGGWSWGTVRRERGRGSR